MRRNIKTNKFSLIFLLILPLSLFFIAADSSLPALDKDYKTKNYRKHYVLISSLPAKDEADQRGITGTGFAVDKDIVFTAGHVCSGVISLQKEQKSAAPHILAMVKINRQGLPEGVVLGAVLEVDEEHDICAIYSENHGIEFLPLSKRQELLEVGDDVLVVGCPKSILYVKEFGTMIAITEDYLSIHIHIERGNSGSPVIRDGEVIGLVTSYSKRMPRQVFATSANRLQKFYNMIKEGIKNDNGPKSQPSD